jgi:hypothetical protein
MSASSAEDAGDESPHPETDDHNRAQLVDDQRLIGLPSTETGNPANAARSRKLDGAVNGFNQVLWTVVKDHRRGVRGSRADGARTSRSGWKHYKATTDDQESMTGRWRSLSPTSVKLVRPDADGQLRHRCGARDYFGEFWRSSRR